MSFNYDELNYLIYRYLQESGYIHTAFAFANESQATSPDINGSLVPVAALLKMIQKGLYYTEAEIGIDEEGNQKNNEPLSLIDAVLSIHSPENSSSNSSSSNSSINNSSSNNLPCNTSSKNDSSSNKPSNINLPVATGVMTRSARLSLEKKLTTTEVKNEPKQSTSTPSVIKTTDKTQLPLASISSNIPRPVHVRR